MESWTKTVRFVRSADFAAFPGLAVAANVSFEWPQRSEVEPDECQQWAICVDQAPAKVRIDVPFLRQVRFATKAIKTLQRRERLLF